jgi:hypothetical protein
VIDQSSGRQAAASDAARGRFSPAQPAAWAWARHWEFWLAMALAVFLRFWRIDLTQYLFDQSGLFGLARTSVTHGLIPLTGIPFSIQTLTPPWSIFALAPFAALSASPLPAVISIATLNVVGVALCYIFALRYFGRRIAAVSTLLYATCGAAINYSRFIWQPNYVAPLIGIWIITLYAGCVDGRRRWFSGNIALLLLAAMFHPSALLLAPVTLVAVLLAPRFPGLRAWLGAVAAVVIVAIPTLIWEWQSNFSDLRSAGSFATGHTSYAPLVFFRLYQLLGGVSPDGANPNNPFDLGLNVLAILLFAVGWLVLTARLLRPARTLAFRRADGVVAASRAWLLALYHGLRADANWRINLLAWLIVSLPPALMIRHSGVIATHYLMMLYPTAFIVSASGAVEAIRWVVAQTERRARQWTTVAALALEAALLVFVIARAGQWIRLPLSLTNPQTFHAYNDYGYPLSVLQGGADTLAQTQARTGAAQIEVITSSDSRYLHAEQYILVGEHPDRISLTPDCLALPAAGAPAWLVAPVLPDSHAATLLASLSNTEQVGSLPMVGGPTYPIYQVSGEEPLLAGERLVTPTVFDDHHGDALRLLSASIPQPGALLLRWQVDAASAPADQTRQFRVVADDNNGRAYVDCEAQHWQTGETLFTWVPLRADGTSDIILSVQTTANGLQMPHALGLRFLADVPIAAPLQPTTATVAPADPLHVTVTANPDGSLTIPAQTLAPAA